MFCLGARLDIFKVFLRSFLKSPLLAIATELLSFVYIGKTIGSFLALLLVYLIGFPPSMFIEIYKKKNPASLFIPPLHVFWFYIFYTPSYFHLNLNYETPILNGLLTFRTFPLLLTAKTECKGCVNKKSNVPTNFFTASFITDLPKYWKQWPP